MNRLNKIEFEDFLGSKIFIILNKKNMFLYKSLKFLEEDPSFPKTDLHMEYLKKIK